MLVHSLFRQKSLTAKVGRVFWIALGICFFGSMDSLADAPDRLGDFQGATGWTNGAPVKPGQMRNHVVVIDFYTSRCSNCLAAVPHVAALYKQFKNDGLIVVGVHTPEMDSERASSLIDATIERLGIEYPVAIDNNHIVWDKFQNQYWPNLLIYDRSGKLVYSHAGEGSYDEINAKVKALLQR